MTTFTPKNWNMGRYVGIFRHNIFSPRFYFSFYLGKTWIVEKNVSFNENVIVCVLGVSAFKNVPTRLEIEVIIFRPNIF